jgi:predicted phage baseplate assembly protein
MSLKDQTPQIDTRRWQDIVDEIRARIPHYTPEWTDLNDNDPGITLTQVFAHLAEMLLFRMQRVPDLLYIKFLELIGIELTPALPARVEVSLAVADGHPDATVLVPKGTQVSAPGDDGPPIVFETERALTALALQLRAVQVDDGAQYRNVSELNAAARGGFDALGADPRPGAALLLGFAFPDSFPAPDAFPAVAVDIAVWTQPDPTQPLVRRCDASGARAWPSAKLVWEGWNGSLWVQLDSLADDTLALTQSGHVMLRVPANAALKRDHLGDYDAINRDSGEPQPALFWLRWRAASAQYEVAPRLLALRINTVPAIQAQTVENEVLGGSSGEPGQRFSFANKPVLNLAGEPPQVEIDEGQGWQPWASRPDLLGSGRHDAHFVVNWGDGELRLGDGEHGAVPVANAANPDANVIARRYRFGGGTAGNVAAQAINNLLTPVAGLDGGATSNLFAAAGGANEETLEAARRRAALSLRARERAVTVDDFELLARLAGGVQRARALPLVHPQFPGVKVPGAVTVIVVPPRRDDSVPAIGTLPPLPSDGLLRTVCQALDARRLLTTELFVIAPRYVKLSVRATVQADDDADTAALKEAVELALRRYFDPLLGGDDGLGWPFGGPLRYSKIVQKVFAVKGVDSVPELVLTVDDEEREPCQDVLLADIAPQALVHLAAHAVEVVTARELESTA